LKEELSHNNEFLKEQIKELNAKLGNISTDTKRKENIISNFTNNSFTSYEFKIKELSNENINQKVLLDKFLQENQDLNKQIEEKTQKFNLEYNSILSIMNNYNNELNGFKAYFINITNEKNFSNERNQHLVNTINQYFIKLKAYEKNISIKTDFIYKNEEELINLKLKNIEINKQIELISNENKELKKNYSHLQEKYFLLKTENENNNRIYNQRIEENIQKNNSNKESEKALIRIKNEKAVLEDDFKALSRENSSLKNKIEELNRILIHNKKEIVVGNKKMINHEKIHSEFQANHSKLREMFDQVCFTKDNLEKIKSYYAEILRERENKIFNILNENNELSQEILQLKSINENTLSENRNYLDKIMDLVFKYKKLHKILFEKHKNN